MGIIELTRARFSRRAGGGMRPIGSTVYISIHISAVAAAAAEGNLSRDDSAQFRTFADVAATMDAGAS